MGKKDKNDGRSSLQKEKKSTVPFTFLNVAFETDQKTVQRHIVFLILASLVTKGVLFFVTTGVFGSFIDLFDIGFYWDHAVMLGQGQFPYLHYSFDYPVLIFIPILLAFIPALVFQSATAFVYAFQLLMTVCDIITILCIYFIALRVWNEKTAFFAGIIYATAFATAYFVLTKYDAFPTCLLMAAVLFTVYGMNTRGYVSATLGFYAKIFPLIAVPFMIFYHARRNDIQKEVVNALKVVVPFSVLLFLPFFLIRPDSIRTYLFATGSSVGIYVNSATYTLYSYADYVAHTGISSATVSVFMYGALGIVLLLLLYGAYTDTEKRPETFLQLVLCAIFAVVLFTKFHSPQYIVWFTPFLCLLVARNLYQILLFYITQIFAYIEFPLMFGRFYTNLEYLNPVGSPDWYLTLIFFTFEYLALLLLLFMIVRSDGGILKKARHQSGAP